MNNDSSVNTSPIDSLGIEIESNENAEFCNSYTCRFSENSRQLYLVSRRETAEKALAENCEWYNSGLDTPCWAVGFDASKFEIYEATIDANVGNF